VASTVQQMSITRRTMLVLVLAVGLAGVGLAVAHPQVFQSSTAEAGMPGFVAPDQDDVPAPVELPVDDAPVVGPPADELPVVVGPPADELPVADGSPKGDEPAEDEDDRDGERRTERDLRDELGGDRVGPRG
jgi:hypothetical protein